MTYTKGNTIYKYKLEEKIGGGNFGQVWIATDLALNTKTAVKLLDKSQYSVDERLIEAKIGNLLQHSNLVNIIGADVVNINGVFIVAISMPYFVNGSIITMLNTNNFIDLKMAINCLIDILRGLEYLHENGYYHCDIKPSNILVGNNFKFLLSDYGISCHSPDHSAVNPRQIYYPHIAPETIRNNLYDTRTDIYQLGLTAFRLINGISKIIDEFNIDPNAFKENVLKGTIITANKFEPYVPLQLRKIIKKACDVNPNNRYQTALEMRRALEQMRILGDCTCDIYGNIILKRTGNEYRYEITSQNKNYNITSYKRNQKSGKEFHFNKFCKDNLNYKDLKKLIQDFCLEILCN